MRYAVLPLLITLSALALQGQSPYWTTQVLRDLSESTIQPDQYASFTLQLGQLEQQLAQAPTESDREAPLRLLLPHPDGGREEAALWQAPVMAPRLAARFPQIRTYAGYLANNPSAPVRLDLTPRGFHVMVLEPGGSWFVDPVQPRTDGVHIAYFKHHLPAPDPKAFRCSVSDTPLSGPATASSRGPIPIGDELRVYRLAVSATGEYTQYHGGTVDGALAAIVTTMNRVNGVYERDVSLRMVLVDNNDEIIFTDPDTDPFTNNEINQNQGVVDSRIGSDNYDIGHVFDRGGGGVASLRSVCRANDKARGYTSLQIPEGDPFDIDYVAHEIGHQYGGNHTQNNPCNRVGSAAFEPGSASTIMGYAGICPPNLQNNSDDYFHVHSQQEMIEYTLLDLGNSCPQIQPTGNTPPQVDPGPGGLFIPLSTPFELTGSAADAEGDSLTYCWEQYDLGPSTTPSNPIGNSPIFRSFKPRPDSIRVFPRIQDILNQTQTVGEILPTYQRELTFRLTVRDNRGGVDWEEVRFGVSEVAGPFRVTSQAVPSTWPAGSFQVITWDVAQTTEAPVAADSVSIFLSLDGGLTYSAALVEKTPNDGRAAIAVPDLQSPVTARVKVKGYRHLFFNINEADIAIQPASGPGLTVFADLDNASNTCGADEVRIPVYTAQFGGLDGAVQLSALDLPAGVTASFSPDTASGSLDTVALVLSGLADRPAGIIDFQLVASAPSAADTLPVSLETFLPLGVPAIAQPSAGATEVSTTTALEWSAASNATSYQVTIAEEPDLENPVFLARDISGTQVVPNGVLQPERTYFWAVSGVNPACGVGESVQGSFTTERHACTLYKAEDVPISFSTSSDFIRSDLLVEDSFPLRDVNVLDLQGSYAPNLSDLTFLLQGPDGTEVQLLQPSCTSAGSFELSFDDENDRTDSSCPLIGNIQLQPTEALSAFDGGNSAGTWSLIIRDDSPVGQLKAWTLEVCYPDRINAVTAAEAPEQNFRLFPNPAGQMFNYELELSEPADLELALFDVLGRRVRTVQPGRQLPGLFRGEVDLRSLAGGRYVVRIMDMRSGRVLASGPLAVSGTK